MKRKFSLTLREIPIPGVVVRERNSASHQAPEMSEAITISLNPYDDGIPTFSDAEIERLIREHVGGPLDRLKAWMSERLRTWGDAHMMMNWYGSPRPGQPAVAVPNLPWWRLVQTTIAVHVCMMMTDDQNHYSQILGLAQERGFTMRNTPWALLEQVGEVLLSAQIADLLAGISCASASEVFSQEAKIIRLHRGLRRILRARARYTLSTREAAREMRLLHEGEDRWRLPDARSRAISAHAARLQVIEIRRRKRAQSELERARSAHRRDRVRAQRIYARSN